MADKERITTLESDEQKITEKIESQEKAEMQSSVPGSNEITKKLPLKKIAIIVTSIVALLAAIVIFLVYGVPAIQYHNGIKAYDSGDYAHAVDIFSTFDGYKESDTYLEQAKLGVHYDSANNLLQMGEYDKAIEEYQKAKDFQNAKDLLLEAYDQQGEALFRDKQYVMAASAFASAGNRNRKLDCGIRLVEENKDYAAAVPILENDATPDAVLHANYAKGMLSMKSGDYQAAMDFFAECFDLLDADIRHQEAVFLMAEKCLHSGYLNKAKTLYDSLPEEYVQADVAVVDRIELLNSNQKFLDLVGRWSATDTYYKAQADSTTSSYYYYWYQDGLKLGTVTVTCPYNDDGTFTVQGTATFPSYQNFSSKASEMKTDLEDFNFSTVCKANIPYQISTSSTTNLSFSGNKFALQYKFVNDFSNVYWHYTYTSKVQYGTRYIMEEDS